MSTSDDSPSSRRLVAVLLIASGLLAFALVVLIVLLATLGSTRSDPATSESAEPSTSASASANPDDPNSAQPTPTPSATSPGTSGPVRAIAGYTVSATLVDCASATAVPVTFTWTTDADSITFGIGTDQADSAPYQTGLPAIGSITVDYQCGQPSAQQIYGIAAIIDGRVVDRAVLAVRE